MMLDFLGETAAAAAIEKASTQIITSKNQVIGRGKRDLAHNAKSATWFAGG